MMVHPGEPDIKSITDTQADLSTIMIHLDRLLGRMAPSHRLLVQSLKTES